MGMSSRLGIMASLIVVSSTGCSVWPTTNDIQPLVVDPVDVLNERIDQLGNTLELESEITELFTNTNSTAQGFVYPVTNYTTARTKKVFGQYIASDSGDRFSGYHTGDDLEVTDLSAPVPVYALTSATVVQKQSVSGYGGVVIVEFVDQTVTYHALYGHLNLASVTAAVGDAVIGGTQLGVLGDDQSEQTDGERKHLHFGLYPYTGTEFYAGYVADDADLVNWLNPADWLRNHSAVEPI